MQQSPCCSQSLHFYEPSLSNMKLAQCSVADSSNVSTVWQGSYMGQSVSDAIAVQAVHGAAVADGYGAHLARRRPAGGRRPQRQRHPRAAAGAPLQTLNTRVARACWMEWVGFVMVFTGKGLNRKSASMLEYTS